MGGGGARGRPVSPLTATTSTFPDVHPIHPTRRKTSKFQPKPHRQRRERGVGPAATLKRVSNKKTKNGPVRSPDAFIFICALFFFFFFFARAGAVLRALVRARRAPAAGAPDPNPARVARVRNGLSGARADPLARFTANIGARRPDPHRAPIAAPREPAAERKKKKNAPPCVSTWNSGGGFPFRRKPAGPGKRARPFPGATARAFGTAL